jgi:Rrf2 family iron-sulfur cluster assembly transcriptional regulator
MHPQAGRTAVISQTAEHALRAVLYLARQPGPTPAVEIAAALGAPPNYLSKTLHRLAKAGVVAGTRGPTGGFRLTTEPEDLPIARIVNAFDEPRGSGVCLLSGRRCNPAKPCTAHQRWTAIKEEARRALAGTTIADLLADELVTAAADTNESARSSGPRFARPLEELLRGEP